MSTSLVPIKLTPEESQFALTEAQTILRRMVLDSVQSIHSKRTTPKHWMTCLSSVPADLSPARY
jgi:hypothetical protein